MGKRTRLTESQLRALNPCRDGLLWYKYQNTTDLATLAQAAYDQQRYADIIWLAVRLMSRKERIRFACDCARDVAHLNTDPRVMAAIEAAERCIEHDTEHNRAAAADAADSAASYVAADSAVRAAVRAAARAASHVAAYAASYVAAEAAVHAAADAAFYVAAEAAYAVKAMRVLGIEVFDGQ